MGAIHSAQHEGKSSFPYRLNDFKLSPSLSMGEFTHYLSLPTMELKKSSKQYVVEGSQDYASGVPCDLLEGPSS